jgi:hypothetical protein
MNCGLVGTIIKHTQLHCHVLLLYFFYTISVFFRRTVRLGDAFKTTVKLFNLQATGNSQQLQGFYGHTHFAKLQF